MKNYILVLLCFAILGLAASCGKDNDDQKSCNELISISNEKVHIMSAAFNTYNANQTSENCQAYKVAVQGWLDAATPLLECPNFTAEEKADIQSSIVGANAALINIQC